jgi:hypothetical protein
MVRISGRFPSVVVAFSLLLSSIANAQIMPPASRESQIGFVGGVSVDPEQGFVGVFWQSPEIGGRFHLRPGIDGGFGSELKLATINVDFIARFPLGASGWDLIQGGGPAIVIARYDFVRGSETDVGAGGSYILGFGHDSGFLGEFRIGGGGNVPNLKLSAGYALSW